jgi:hypothetical protein
MNYNTLMSSDRSIPCTKDDFDFIKMWLDTANEGDSPTGIECEWDEKDVVYFYGEENADVDSLPEAVLEKIGMLLTNAKVKYVEFQLAFTSNRMVPDSQGGALVRILQSGEMVEQKRTWPKRAQ